MGYKIPISVMPSVAIGNNDFFPVASGGMGFRRISVESEAEIRISHAGKFSGLRSFITIGDANFNGSVITLRVNGVDTTLTVTMTAAGAVFTGTSSEIYVVPGDLVSLRITGMGAGTSNRLVCVTILFEADGDKAITYIAHMQRAVQTITNLRRYAMLNTINNFGALSEAEAQSSVRNNSRVVNMHINVGTNTRNGITTCVLRKNGADAASINIPASTTGRFNLDTSVNLIVDDLINTNITFAGSSGAGLWRCIQYTIESDNPREVTLWGGTSTFTATSNIAFSAEISNSTSSFAYTLLPACTIDSVAIYVGNNTQTVSQIPTLRTNGASRFNIATVPALTIGRFINTASSYTSANNEGFNINYPRTNNSTTVRSTSARLTMPAELRVFITNNLKT